MFKSTIRKLQSAILLFSLPALACGVSSQSVAERKPSAAGAADKPKQTTPFDGERAFAHVKAQVDLGPHPAGSAAIEKVREYLVKELKSYGLKTTLDEFTPNTPRGKVKMKNVVAELPGESSRVIIISSHYDTKEFKEFVFVGANDGGSSTGILLELARVLAADKQTKRRFTYQFVFFDGEEAFCREWSACLNGQDHTYGSRHTVERWKAEKKLAQLQAMILLDMVGDKDLTIPREQTSSGWLVEAIWSTAAAAGYGKQFPNRQFSIGDDDHMPFLQAGVPAVDIIDFEYGGEDNPYWHTKDDTLDKISAQSLKIVGDVVLLSLPKIEAQIR